MADELLNKPLSDFNSASTISDDTLFFASVPNGVGGLNTANVTANVLKTYVANGLFVDFDTTLTVGATTVTISDAGITTTSIIDIYTDTYGVNPTAVVVSTGSIALTFNAQESAVAVKVRLWLM